MTKRLRAAAAGEEEEEEVENILESNDVANFLLLHSHHGPHGSVAKSSRKQQQCYVERTFECKTCYRQFPSFQALGGHCTTHRRSSKAIAGTAPRRKKPRVHECAVCGMVFTMGQALGGHMRRHKPTTTTTTVDLFRSHDRGRISSSTDEEEEERSCCCSEDPKLLLLDLNLPPPEEPEEDIHDLKLHDFFLILDTSL